MNNTEFLIQNMLVNLLKSELRTVNVVFISAVIILSGNILWLIINPTFTQVTVSITLLGFYPVILVMLTKKLSNSKKFNFWKMFSRKILVIPNNGLNGHVIKWIKNLDKDSYYVYDTTELIVVFKRKLDLTTCKLMIIH
jgi:hypothetical protein